MTRLLLASLCSLVLTAQVAAQTQLDQQGTPHVPEKTTVPEQGVEVPLLIRDGVPAVEVMLNGKGPFVMLVDTCGMGTVHPDDDVTKQLELPVVGQVEASDGGGGATRELDLIRVDRLQIGDAVFEGLSGPTRDYGMEGGRQPIAGAIGVHTFADCLFTIDFPNRKLRIERGELPAADGGEILQLIDSEPLPTIEWKLAGEEPISTHLDTGNMGGIAVSPQVAQRLKFTGELQTIGEARTITSRSAVKQGRLTDTLQLGRHQLQQPRVAVMDFIADANLGSEMLSNFALTVDLRNARVKLHRAEDTPIATVARYMVGVMLKPDRGAFVVDNLVPGGAAEAAGLQRGDVVIEVDGVSSADFDVRSIREALGGPDAKRVKIERDGQPQEISITPRKVD